MKLRIWSTRDASKILTVNDSEIPHVSQITEAELQHLAQQSCYFKVAETPSGELAGFLLALQENAAYDSLNFQWFKVRYPRFTYVDRIVILKAHQGRGIGKLFYEDLESVAITHSGVLCCEVNLRPLNVESIAFHERLGFREVGVQDTEAGKKTVSLLLKTISPK